jgi:hypothetical protein
MHLNTKAVKIFKLAAIHIFCGFWGMMSYGSPSVSCMSLDLIPIENPKESANINSNKTSQISKIHENAGKLKIKNPELFNQFIVHIVENGFFIGPKMLEIFERQMINSGLLIYDVERNSFVTTKDQAEKNKNSLEYLINNHQEIEALSTEILSDLVKTLALDTPTEDADLVLDIRAQNSFHERPWDSRKASMNDLVQAHKVLYLLLQTSNGKALLYDLIKESTPYYASILDELLIYTNKSVDLASVLTSRAGWSVALSVSIGIIEPASITTLAAATIGAAVQMPGITDIRLYLRNRFIKKFQQEVSWNMAYVLKNNSYSP